MNYLTIPSDITNDLSKIASLETQLNELKAENDDFDNRINGAVDLEEIKKRAMNDLGMQYAIKELNADHALIMNPDAEVPEEAIKAMPWNKGLYVKE